MCNFFSGLWTRDGNQAYRCDEYETTAYKEAKSA